MLADTSAVSQRPAELPIHGIDQCVDKSRLHKELLSILRKGDGSVKAGFPGSKASTRPRYRSIDYAAQEIRLLRLLPKTENSDVLQLEIVHHILAGDNSSKPYYALSYPWGPPHDTGTVLVDGVPIEIRRNLYKFLNNLRDNHDLLQESMQRQHLQSQNATIVKQIFPQTSVLNNLTSILFRSSIEESLHTRTETVGNEHAHIGVLLWADYLCINQQDVGEKNHQVGLMSTIYGQASTVIGCLNESHVDHLRTLKRELDLPRDVDGRLRFFPKIKTRELQRAIAKVYLDVYWTRLWIVQELVLAKKFWLSCVDVLMDWDDFTMLIDHLKHLSRDQEVQLPNDFDDNNGDLFPSWADRERRPKPLDFNRAEYMERETYMNYERMRNTVQGYEFLRKDRDRVGLSGSFYGRASQINYILSQTACGDDKDRIYGMLGMLSSDTSARIQVDYKKPMFQIFYEGCLAVAQSYSIHEGRALQTSFFFDLLRRLCWARGPVTLDPISRESNIFDEVHHIPSDHDLSSLTLTQSVILQSNRLLRRIEMVERVAAVVKRGDSYVNRWTQYGPQELVLCSVYHIVTVHTQVREEDDRLPHSLLVLSIADIHPGDHFLGLDGIREPCATQLVIGSNPWYHSPYKVVGTACIVGLNLDKDRDVYDFEWASSVPIPNPIRWLKTRSKSPVVQKLEVQRSLFGLSLGFDWKITMNAAAVMEHLENILICREHSEHIRNDARDWRFLWERSERVDFVPTNMLLRKIANERGRLDRRKLRRLKNPPEYLRRGQNHGFGDSYR